MSEHLGWAMLARLRSLFAEKGAAIRLFHFEAWRGRHGFTEGRDEEIGPWPG